MIYVHNLAGKNLYTRLDDVLNIHEKNNQLQHDGYEKLGKAVNENYNNYKQEMKDKHNTKPILPPYSYT